MCKIIIILDKIYGPKTYIKRPVYSERIKPYIGKQIIKVITGQRRVRKSYILFQLADEIKNSEPDANIIYVNKELKDFEFIKTDDD